MDLTGPLMLLFTPGLVPGVTQAPGQESALEVQRALDVLGSALRARVDGKPVIGAVQVRIKAAPEAAGNTRTPARATWMWAERVRELLFGIAEAPALLINDRVDVALALGGVENGIAGVHLGQGDLPVELARRLLGPDALIGRSTHDFKQVVWADEEGADYVGFGPIFATTTKGYTNGLGGERAWIAKVATGLPLFAIGGIAPSNISEVAEVGRAAVSSAILSAEDPQRIAEELARVLLQG